MSDDNIIKFGAIQGGKESQDEDTIPQHNYAILDTDGVTHTAKGFLIFTPQHVAIMQNLAEGALPVKVLPLNMVKHASIVEDVPL